MKRIDNTSIYHVYKVSIKRLDSATRVQYEIELLERCPKQGSLPLDELKLACKGDKDSKNQALGVWPTGCKTLIRK